MKPPPLLCSGAPIRDAAGWVGAACWTELRVHEVITGWLAVEPESTVQLAFWTVRADRADQSQIWHDRLPELAEMPRSEFVIPRSHSVVDRLDRLAALLQPGDTDARVGGLDGVLADLEGGYGLHQSVAVGPADGPVGGALVDGLIRAARSRALLAPLNHGAGHASSPLP